MSRKIYFLKRYPLYRFRDIFKGKFQINYYGYQSHVATLHPKMISFLFKKNSLGLEAGNKTLVTKIFNDTFLFVF